MKTRLLAGIALILALATVAMAADPFVGTELVVKKVK